MTELLYWYSTVAHSPPPQIKYSSVCEAIGGPRKMPAPDDSAKTTQVRSSRRCATCAIVLSIVMAVLVAAGLGLGGWQIMLMRQVIVKTDASHTVLTQAQAHLAAQLQQLQQVNTDLGKRLLMAESGLQAVSRTLQAGASRKRSTDQKDVEEKEATGGKKKGAKWRGKDRGKAKESGEAEQAAAQPNTDKKESEGAKGDGDQPSEDTADTEDKETPKAKGRKGRKGKRHGRG